MIDVTSIVANYLREHGYAGLGDGEYMDCACDLEAGLFPCDGEGKNCVPVYRVPCVPNHICRQRCDAWGYGSTWCYTQERPEQT